MTSLSIADNASAHRYEATLEGKVAGYAEYNVMKNGIMFTHTEVMPEFEGKGIGSQLAKFVLDDVRARGLQAIPVCQFIAGYIKRHPEYLDLVSAESRLAYKL